MKIWSVSLNLEVFTHNLGCSFANERTIVVPGSFVLARLQELYRVWAEEIPI